MATFWASDFWPPPSPDLGRDFYERDDGKSLRQDRQAT